MTPTVPLPPAAGPAPGEGDLSFEDFMRALWAEASAGGDGGGFVRPSWAHDERTGGAAFAALVDRLREARDAVAAARLDEEQCHYLAERVGEITAYVDRFRAEPTRRSWANRFDLLARGSALVPALEDLRIDPVHGVVRAGVRLGASYTGAGEAAHGGAVALVFDEVLGLVANSRWPYFSRTAYLHVDYRALTPIDADLVVEGRMDRIEGRKRFTVGELRRTDGTVVAESEGLFIELRPGHE